MVVILSVEDPGLVPVRVTGVVEKAQVAPVGRPEQVSEMLVL